MDQRFTNLFALSEAEAIALLDKPLDQLTGEESRYVAASHLAAFPSEASIQALIRAVGTLDDALDNRIVRRKAVESLGKLKAVQALEAIAPCLAEEDTYLVENTVWSIGEIGQVDPSQITPSILEAIAQLLGKPNQTYRVIIQTLAKFGYRPAWERIYPFLEHEDKTIASAAIAALLRLGADQDFRQHWAPELQGFLVHPNVYTRRLCIQDLVDVRQYEAIPDISQTPVSLVFRLRGIRLLAEAGLASGELNFPAIQPYLERVLWDHPRNLVLVHAYDRVPTLDFLIQELYQTDFGRCYLAIQTLLEHYSSEAGAALEHAYTGEAYDDYGANYHVVKLWGWLRYLPACDRLLQALHRPEPQFQKSRAAAALALAELGDELTQHPVGHQVIPALQQALASPIWDLRYASFLALEQLGASIEAESLRSDPDILVRSRAIHGPGLIEANPL